MVATENIVVETINIPKTMTKKNVVWKNAAPATKVSVTAAEPNKIGMKDVMKMNGGNRLAIYVAKTALRNLAECESSRT